MSAVRSRRFVIEHLRSSSHENGLTWNEACEQFLQAVADGQQEAVRRLLREPHCGGAGLRQWVSSLVLQGGKMPDRLAPALVDVYLCDPEALPLHDCEACGLAVPVRPNRLSGADGEPEHLYFPTCPSCGGRTGLYCFWSRSDDDVVATASSRRRVSR